ncbi:MAG: transcription-repair coupling factor [Amoebophilaceae bacterium]|nr:transcription-repair coupling factor [Amoebophilaceae bacterium]
MEILCSKELINLYKQTTTIAKLSHYVKQQANKTPFCLKGITGSLDGLLVTALQQQCNQLQLVVLADQENAAAFYGDLLALSPSQSILLLPGTAEGETYLAESAKIIQDKRAEIVHALTDHKPIAIVVTHLAALMEQVVDPSLAKKLRLKLELNQTLTLSTLIDYLQQNQFVKVDFVYSQGQFAIRGGIVDLYSVAASLPYRIALWGNQVESIRVFDPKSQKSLKAVKKLTILPHTTAEGSTALSYISFAHCLPVGSVVWFKDKSNALESLQGGQSLLDELSPFHQIELATGSADPSIHSPATGSAEDHIIHYASAPQPYFQKKFDVLADDLDKKQHDGYTTFITATAIGQFSRLQAVLEDKSAHFTPLLVGLREGYVDHTAKIACYTDHQLFNRYYKHQPTKPEPPTLLTQQANPLQIGDYVVHSDYGIGRFSGLHTLNINGCKQEVIRLIYKNNDTVFVHVNELYKITTYSSKDATPPVMNKLGTTAWQNKKNGVKKQIKDIATELITLYAARKQAVGFAFGKDTPLDAALAASFYYEDTPDQATAIAAVKEDMERPYPMDRLICGDVGFGKTEIAIRAAFKAAIQGKQVAVLVPTTILALQHYNSFTSRLADLPVHVSYLNRFKTKQEIQKTLADTAAGKINILIGTHKLLTDAVKFKELGLLIIDEEQKFGVSAKEKLKKLRVHVDTLTLTATPIPRTLHFSLMGARDLSILVTPPANRRPVKTKLTSFDLSFIKEAVTYEIARGGQVFFVHNSVSTIQAMAKSLSEVLPTIRICVAHGQMAGPALEQKMLQFIAGHYDVLVSTSIIESGIDIANANTIIINHSHLLGLADLHQMRGRVGRSNAQAFCYLLIPSYEQLTHEAQLRLSAVEEFSALGDGFKLAMRDLDIRGAGDLLGASQSGFIADVGFEVYCKLLEEVVEEVKYNDFKELFSQKSSTKSWHDCSIETDCEAFLPVEYVQNSAHRMALYTRLNEIKAIEQLTDFRAELLDRFGPLPLAAEALLAIVPLRWEAQRIGFQKLSFKNKVLSCHLGADFQKNSPAMWRAVLQYIEDYPASCRLKQVGNELIWVITGQVDDIKQVRGVLNALTRLEQKAPKKIV